MTGHVRPQCAPDMLAFLPACRSGLEHHGPAECNKAPFMYEMKGAFLDCRHLHGHRGAIPGFTSAALCSATGRTLVLHRNCLDLTSDLPIDNPLTLVAFAR
jgi:hypothetical protein